MTCNNIKIKINDSEELIVEMPDKEFVGTLRNDSSMLLNVVQQFTNSEIHTVELVDESKPEQNCNIEVNPEEKKLWTDENTNVLIDIYKNHDDEFQTGVKKLTWNKIAKRINEKVGVRVTGAQCDTKWKGLLRNYKLIKKHNETSGNEPKHWRFYNALDRVLYMKPEITPVATCSSARGLQTDDSQSISTESSNCTPTSSRSETRKRKILENSVERRHKERLDRQDRFLKIMENIANKMTNTPEHHCQCNHDKKVE